MPIFITVDSFAVSKEHIGNDSSAVSDVGVDDEERDPPDSFAAFSAVTQGFAVINISVDTFCCERMHFAVRGCILLRKHAFCCERMHFAEKVYFLLFVEI